MTETQTLSENIRVDVSQSAAVIVPGPENWLGVFRFVNSLSWADYPVLITVGTGDESVPRGAFVIPLGSETGQFADSRIQFENLMNASSRFGVNVSRLARSSRLTTVKIRPLTVGIYGGGGAPFHHAALLKDAGFRLRFLSEGDVRAGRLNQVDVFIMPGGGARSVMGQIDPLGVQGCREIAEFVRNGGMYIGSCAGSYGCVLNADEFYEVCPTQRHLQLLNARSVRGEAPRGRYGFHSPGVGVVTLSNSMPDHPVMYGMPEQFQIVHYNGPVFEATPSREVTEASEIFGLASFSGFGKNFTPSERFHGGDTPNQQTFLHDCIDEGRYAIVAGEFGLGRVVAFGPHPEFGFDVPMVGQELPGRMLVNAIMWQAWHNQGAIQNYLTEGISYFSIPPTNALAQVAAAAREVAAVTEKLSARKIDNAPEWLKPGLAISTFGKAPEKVWQSSLVHIHRLSASIITLVADLSRSIDNALNPYTQSQILALRRIDKLALDKRPPESGQDLGYQGAIELLVRAKQQCQKALDNWDVELGEPKGSYDFPDRNPYQLIGASYMSAIGHVAGAYQLTRAMSAEWSSANLSDQLLGTLDELGDAP